MSAPSIASAGRPGVADWHLMMGRVQAIRERGEERLADEQARRLRDEFPGCQARPWRVRGGWGVVVQHGLSRAVTAPEDAREWLAAHKAPAGEDDSPASPAGQDG